MNLLIKNASQMEDVANCYRSSIVRNKYGQITKIKMANIQREVRRINNYLDKPTTRLGC